MLFAATAITGTYLLASSALTAAFGVSAVYDRIDGHRTASGVSITCETAGLLGLILGFVCRNTDPFYAAHAMIIGALLLTLGTLIRPRRDMTPPDALVKRAQVGHYRAALVCLLTLGLFQSVAPLVH
jgi:hypothetical protein